MNLNFFKVKLRLDVYHLDKMMAHFLMFRKLKVQLGLVENFRKYFWLAELRSASP